MRFTLMVEPQQGFDWPRHVAIAQRAEQVGFSTLYRSDHYDTFPGPLGRRSVDAFVVIGGLVRETGRLRHGTLVSPVTFRHPGNVAKMVSSLDEMSDGRIELGLGAGWNLEEHQRHAFAFPDIPTRREMLEEQLQVMAVRLWYPLLPRWPPPGQHPGRRFAAAHLRPAPSATAHRGHPGQAVGVRVAARATRTISTCIT